MTENDTPAGLPPVPQVQHHPVELPESANLDPVLLEASATVPASAVAVLAVIVVSLVVCATVVVATGGLVPDWFGLLAAVTVGGAVALVSLAGRR